MITLKYNAAFFNLCKQTVPLSLYIHVRILPPRHYVITKVTSSTAIKRADFVASNVKAVMIYRHDRVSRLRAFIASLVCK